MRYLIIIMLAGCSIPEIESIDAAEPTAMPDSGLVQIDSGPEPDSGPDPVDSGPGPVDPDGGSIDSGAMAVDAGPSHDAGRADAGSPPPDAGPPPPGPPAVQVSAGPTQTCARRADERVLCWGAGVTRATAVSLTDVIDISVGGRHACALQRRSSSGGNGYVYCWGANNYGQVGAGSPSMTEPPTRVASADGGLDSVFTAITAGEDHSCALYGPGLGQCWGRNHREQLGNPSVTSPFEASSILVDGFNNAVAIESYGDRTCVLRDDAIWCWGNDMSFAMERPAADLAVGGSHSCTVTGSATSTHQCWGDNSYGQLGRSVRGPWAVDAVAGEHHSCALYDDSSVRCWGRNQFGQLGTGSTAPFDATPGLVLSGAIGLSAGVNHTCAVLASGEVQCWGDNAFGQLGDGTTTQSSTPVTVIGL